LAARRFKGFGGLKTPQDLLRKVRHDFGRLKAEPMNEYAAFDFFVSSYHMLDWLHPSDKASKEAEENSTPLLQICSHLANGAKHFEARMKHHKSVSDVVAEEGKFFGAKFFGDGFFGTLYVQLEGQAASLFGAEVSAVDLASKVLAFWEADPRLGKVVQP
jgi:hypothetical protein